MIVDTNVYLSRWPFRRLRGDEPSELATMLAAKGVHQAWVGSFDALLHKDLAAVNERLTVECRRRSDQLLLPFGTVHPRQPDWREDLRRCHEVHKMRGIRLFPAWHGYPLDDPEFIQLLAHARERNLLVQIVLRMEDERTQHPLLKLPAIDVRPLAGTLGKLPRLRVMVVNGFRDLRGIELQRAARAGEVFFEIATLEGAAGVDDLITQVGVERITFGSLTPYFSLESAWLKLRESALNADQLEAIRQGNARRLLG